MQTMNAELARQHARVQAARARIHRGVAPVPVVVQLLPKPVARPALPQPVEHVRWWRRVERTRAFGPTVEDILEVAAEVWGVAAADLMARSRFVCHWRPRQAVAYLSRRHTRRSVKEIGRRLGGRDHSTIVAACQAVETALLHGDAALADRLQEVRRRLGLDVCGRSS